MPLISIMKRILGTGDESRAKRLVDVLERRVDALPSTQTAIDALEGWSLPPMVAGDGTIMPYTDPRIVWCLERMGSLAGRTVLELGPLDGVHTSMLSQAGPASILAIEANALAFLRCLVTKQIMDLKNTSFLLGDFNAWMSQNDSRYDLVVASGVLYHSRDPVRFIELICARATCFYLWTHYFDDEIMKADDLRRVPFSGRAQQQIVAGKAIELYERSYFRAWRDSRFCGGFQDRHFWMKRSDITWMISRLGFACEIAHDEPHHVNGPAFSLFARRADPS